MKYYVSIRESEHEDIYIWAKSDDNKERCIFTTNVYKPRDYNIWNKPDAGMTSLDDIEYFIEITEEEAFLEMV